MDFIEKAKCRNCKYWKKECPYPQRQDPNGEGTCPAFTEVEEDEMEKRKEIHLVEVKKDVLKRLQREVNQQLALKMRTDATELIVEQIKKDNHIYTTKDDVKSEMWIYQSGIYKPNGKSYVKEYCRIVLEGAYTINLANDVINKIETDTYIDQEEFFKNTNANEIPLKNGILNVLTLKLIEFDPKKILFNKLPVNYDKDATCDAIDNFLKDILASEEDIEVAYELVGSGLYKDYFTEKAAMFVGSGRNGKSKFLSLIRKLVGIENCCSVPIRTMKEDNSSLCELHNKLFNLAGDLNGGDLKDTGVFKESCGRDEIQAHRKFLRDLKFTNFAKHIFACNELPRVYDKSDGFWDRWILLQFPYTFLSQKEINKIPKEIRKNIKLKDPEIINKITSNEELSGFLNKSLEGLKRVWDNKTFSQTKGSKEIKDFWIRNSDSFVAFCIDSIDEDYECFITKKDIRQRYNRYCKLHQIKGSGDKNIKATLQDRYGAIDDRKMINGEVKFVWEGIKFNSNL
jgi:P4 family phage/plasmid primase-like protien